MLFDVNNHMGVYDISNETRTTLEVSGVVKAKNSTISGITNITGLLDGIHLVLGELKVTGNCSLQDSQVKGKTEITGLLKAIKTTFENDVTVRTSRAYAENSLFRKNLTVTEESPEQSNKQILTLKNTTIYGKVTFNSNKGEIILEGNSTINGEVKGAVVTHGK